MSDHPTNQTTAPPFAPGQHWKPKTGGMTRIIRELTVAGVVYDEGWPSEVEQSFDRWETWAKWLLQTGAELS